jgi:hypothetical protein
MYSTWPWAATEAAPAKAARMLAVFEVKAGMVAVFKGSQVEKTVGDLCVC